MLRVGPAGGPLALGRPTLHGLVDDGAGELGVVGPGAAVEVVGADAGPRVVDYADLGVDVHGCALVVLEAIHRDSVAAGPARCSMDSDLATADEVRRLREPAALVGVQGDNGDEQQVGLCLERRAEPGGHVA